MLISENVNAALHTSALYLLCWPAESRGESGGLWSGGKCARALSSILHRAAFAGDRSLFVTRDNKFE